MNKRIILIEDRPARQKQLLGENKLKELSEIEYLDMPLESECRTEIININNKQMDSLSEYSLIIIHKSSISQDGLNSLNEFCNKEKKDLIFFSGSIGQAIYDNEKYQCLSINSGDLYTDKIIPFVQKYNSDNIKSFLELIYGSKWELELRLRYNLLKMILDEEYNNEDKQNEYIATLEDQLENIEKTLGDEFKNNDEEINNIIESI